MSLRGLPALLRYVVILCREIVLASISVTKLVFGPTEKLRSGFVAYPMEAETDLEVTTLANSITLTPGTITVHVEPSEKLLVMHAIDVGEDPEGVRESTRSALESNILRWTRAGRGGGRGTR